MIIGSEKKNHCPSRSPLRRRCMGCLICRHKGCTARCFTNHRGLAAFIHRCSYSWGSHACTQAVCFAWLERMGLLFPAWFPGYHSSPMVVIQWITDSSSHNHSMDRRKCTIFYGSFRLVSIKRTPGLGTFDQHPAGNHRCDNGRQQR